MSKTHRCGKPICDFSNLLWPGMDAMTALRDDRTGHDGVFLVAEKFVSEYIERFRPQVLRHDRRAKTYGCRALNFGQSKGLQFQRVLIVPTGPMRKYLRNGSIDDIEKSRDKLHVAVTRARHSVSFVFDGRSTVVTNRWNPDTA